MNFTKITAKRYNNIMGTGTGELSRITCMETSQHQTAGIESESAPTPRLK